MKIMRVLWDADGPITSKEIGERIPDNAWKYTTLVTTIGNLVDKGFVNSEKIRRKHAHLYWSAITENDYAKSMTKEVLNTAYKGSMRNMITAIADRQLTDEQFERLMKIIEE